MLTRRLALGALAAAPVTTLPAQAVPLPVTDLPVPRETPPVHFIYNGHIAADPTKAEPHWLMLPGTVRAPTPPEGARLVRISDDPPEPGDFRHGDSHFERRPLHRLDPYTFERTPDTIGYFEHRYVGEVRLWHAFDCLTPHGFNAYPTPVEIYSAYDWSEAQFGPGPRSYLQRDEFLPQPRWRTTTRHFLFRDRADAVTFAQRWMA